MLKSCKAQSTCFAPQHLYGGKYWPLTGGRVRAQDFAKMQLSEIEDNIVSRRNRIFLLMEEVRRLRIQRRLKVKAPAQVPPSA
jgi:hypothetical protein